MRRDEMFPRLGLREVVLVLLVVGGGLAALIINATSSKPPRLTGPAARRLTLSHGNYPMSFPRRTTLSRARAEVLRTFPADTRTLDFSDKAFCATLIVTSERLSQLGLAPGVVDIEFLTGSKQTALRLFDPHDVDLALITLLQSPDQRPSC